MAALDEDDIEKLFSGAPQFFARNESHFQGAPHPSVAFPFDEELEIRDLTDHVQVQSRAWSGLTAWPHLTRDLHSDASAKAEAEERTKAHFHIRCRERPNMLSMQGLEKGTMGYEAALELSAGDALEEEQFGFESVGTKARAIVDARERMLARHGWLRRLPEPDLLERLRRNSQLYRNNDLRSRKSLETYEDLYRDFMRPCNTVIDKSDHYSLANQIVALLKCLGTANVWIDLSRVEWRIRLGQALWGERDGDELVDATSVHDTHDAGERAAERYWLFMQILVATELLLRLDAVTEGVEYGSGGFKPTDVAYFERGATPTVKWSLLLARSWLDNVEVVKEADSTTTAAARPRPPRRATSWLAALVSKMSSAHQGQPQPPYHYMIQGRHGQRQVDGLIRFARELMWPGIDEYEAMISRNARHAAEATPARGDVPARSEPKRSSYFGAWDVTSHRGKQKPAARTQRRRLAAALHSSGWLTKSYVFGLLLPGEALFHCLMATLLESDDEALARLGPCANLSGGFVYGDKSFWSTSCVVGRVLAAGNGAAECMGWISTDVIPKGIGDGWLHIEVADVADDVARLGRKARLWGKKKIERESSILGNQGEGQVLPADFVIPHEYNYSTVPPTVSVQLVSLELAAPAGSVPATPLTEIIATPVTEHGKAPEMLSYPAILRFSLSLGEASSEEEVKVALTHDINFVTAHPCAPSHRVRVLKSPTSPTLQNVDVTGSDKLGKGSRSAHRMGHALHKYYQYTVVHVSELIQKPRTSLFEFIGDPLQGKGRESHVLVVDCVTHIADGSILAALDRVTSTPSTSPSTHRKPSFTAAAQMFLESQKRLFGSDLEVLVRALCAQRGWNAIISRRKRGCLACAIREAGALGWRVIVRVE